MTRAAFETHWISSANAHHLERVAPGTFDHAIDPKRLERYLADPANWMCVTLQGNVVISMCMCVVHHHPDKPTELFLDEIGTGDDWRRKGAARLLMQMVFERADAEGIEEVWLVTEPDNEAAKALYEGFKHEREDAVIYHFDW